MQVKGTAIKTVLVAVEQLYGRDGLTSLKAALPADIRSQLEPMVLASSSYPIAVSAALHEAIRTVLGGGSVAANRRIGEKAARIDFGGIYRVFVRVMDYETLLRGTDRAWKQYNSRGKVEWLAIEPGHGHGRISDVEGWTEPMWNALAGRFEGILMLGGARAATVKLKDVRPTEGQLIISWTP